MLLALDSLAHLLVDGVCASTVFGKFGGETLAFYIIVYNTLAFSTQCLVGLITDRLGKARWFTGLAALCVALGFFLPLPDAGRVVLIGLGNSVFHVGGGTRTLRVSGGKAKKLGVFVAPGAMGLTLGTLFPNAVGLPFAVALAVYGLAVLFLPDAEAGERAPIRPGKAGDAPMLVSVLLTAAVAVRAIGGSAVTFPWKSGVLLSVLTTFFVFSGKTLGGFAADYFGIRKSAWISVPLAALLVAFCSNWMVPSLVGQLCVNLTMPVTLFLLYRAMPSSPGFAFGLAASALWPGTIAGGLIELTGLWRYVLILVCFAFSLFAILYAERKMRDEALV